MGCGESKEELHVLDEYQRMLKNPNVVAAMEAVQIDVRDAGLRFYRVFALMDIDGSRSIDLDEFHAFFQLPRTKLSDQVFSALGHQSAARDVTFDDFILNTWNFCTMSMDEIRDPIFNLYDDDHSGTLDSAECDSLFRLLYNTSDLSPSIKKSIADLDANGGGVLDKAEFGVLCRKNTALLRPVLDIQSKARLKARKMFSRWPLRLAQEDLAPSKRTVKIDKPDPAPPTDTRPMVHRASEIVAAIHMQKERDTFEAWILTQQQEHPLVDQYLKAHCEVFVTKTHLTSMQTSEQWRDSVAAIQLLTNLRHRLAINEKRFEEARSKLMKQWGEEEALARDARHETVRASMNILSPQTLLKHAGKQNAVGTYLQKKLDTATDEVRAEYQQRWELLERACSLLADRALAAATAPLERTQPKKEVDKRQPVPKANAPTRVIPGATTSEIWTEHFDPINNRAYYVSSLGIST